MKVGLWVVLLGLFPQLVWGSLCQSLGLREETVGVLSLKKKSLEKSLSTFLTSLLPAIESKVIRLKFKDIYLFKNLKRQCERDVDQPTYDKEQGCLYLPRTFLGLDAPLKRPLESMPVWLRLKKFSIENLYLKEAKVQCVGLSSPEGFKCLVRSEVKFLQIKSFLEVFDESFQKRFSSVSPLETGLTEGGQEKAFFEFQVEIRPGEEQ
ncbi:MAG: hypothetical protein D6797_03735, partial [Bdellovibrio sp.]